MKPVMHPRPVVDKFRAKFSKWKTKALSFGGYLTLVNSVVNSLPLYFFSLFRTHQKIINILDCISRRFLWDGDDSQRKIHWVAWKNQRAKGVLVWDILSPSI